LFPETGQPWKDDLAYWEQMAFAFGYPINAAQNG